MHEKNEKIWKEKPVYTIDLNETEDGIFPCPDCGTIISPDDETDKHYEIIDTKIKDDMLEALTLGCKKCYHKIELTGFP